MPIKISHHSPSHTFTMRLPGTFWRNQQLLLLALHEEEDDNDKPDWFNMLLDEEGRHCRDRCLPQMTLLLPTKEMTPWKKLCIRLQTSTYNSHRA
jgi:hypothetical protein